MGTIKEPNVSIIVPVYNVEPFLARCVDSILAQTYHNFELILIDDGSQDRSGQICEEYAEHDKRVRVLHQKNSGQSVARNRGLDICKGDYIYFCDSDDWIEPELLETAVKKIVEFNSDLVQFQYFIHEENKRTRTWINSDREIIIKKERDKIHFLTDELLEYKFGWELWRGLFRTQLIRENDICFPNGINISEDLYFYIQYCLYSKKISVISLPLYHYYVRNGSTMQKSKGKTYVNQRNELFSKLVPGCNGIVNKLFFIIHYKLISAEFKKLPVLDESSEKRYIEELDSIENQELFYSCVRRVLKHGKWYILMHEDTYMSWSTLILYKFFEEKNLKKYQERKKNCEMTCNLLRKIRMITQIGR